MQALAAQGMAPKFLAYVDKKGRPLWCVLIQMGFGLLAFVNEAAAGTTFFDWLLALSGIADFFVWGSICLAHIRFRQGWAYHGHSTAEIPYKAKAGVIGSYIGLFLNVLCLMASFYAALVPFDAPITAENFFMGYIAAPLILALYLFWKLYSRHWQMMVPLSKMDVTSGMRMNIQELQEMAQSGEKPQEKTWLNLPWRILHTLF
jgi:amino acid transporter